MKNEITYYYSPTFRQRLMLIFYRYVKIKTSTTTDGEKSLSVLTWKN